MFMIHILILLKKQRNRKTEIQTLFESTLRIKFRFHFIQVLVSLT